MENSSKLPIRLGTDKRAANYPARFTATARYKDFVATANELSLTASSLTYGK